MKVKKINRKKFILMFNKKDRVTNYLNKISFYRKRQSLITQYYYNLIIKLKNFNNTHILFINSMIKPL